MSNKKIYVFDTTLRDGEQVPGCQLNTVEKIEVAKALEALGVDVLEAGFPISSPGDFKSVEEICKNIKKPTICALTRAIKKDIDVAADALKHARRGRIHTGIGVSSYHIQNKLRSTPEKVIEQAVEAIKHARKLIDDVEFFAEDAGRADNAFLAKMIEAVIKAGATVVNIPDTTGYCFPNEYGAKIKYLVDHVKNIDKAIISTHCHNDLGMATANTVSGVLNGARQVEVTINGIGERAGNSSLEEVVMALKTRKNLDLDINIRTEKIFKTSRLVSSLMNMPVQANKAIVGRNAFAHSSGIHQDGVLKHRETYEIINPADVGISESSINLTARSGRAALKHRLDILGHKYEGDKLNAIYEKFLELADRKKDINDEDLQFLIGHQATAKKRHIKLDSLVVVCGKSTESISSVKLIIDGELHSETSSGNGPVDAAFSAIKKMVKQQFKLEEFLIQAITRGSDDIGKVHVQIECKGNLYYGFSANTDIITASVEALIDAINKII